MNVPQDWLLAMGRDTMIKIFPQVGTSPGPGLRHRADSCSQNCLGPANSRTAFIPPCLFASLKDFSFCLNSI